MLNPAPFRFRIQTKGFLTKIYITVDSLTENATYFFLNSQNERSDSKKIL
jgi:hypothetical protein